MQEILPPVFLGESNDYFINLLEKENEFEKLEKLFSFFERMETEGDDYVSELLSVTILKRIGDDKKILNKTYKYMGKETRKDSNEIEKFLE
ncbi:DUF7674 family protein [Peribacillus frigoritolerans]|uniref:DUF7674 family protein n=1 Tax=Peribacillus frigoritolerans TaxID=450367 RepID=UPI003BB1EED9